MADTPSDIPEPAARLKEWLIQGGADGGEVRVVDARVTWDEDAEGEPILRFSVALGDPREETWPVKDIVGFHRRVEDRALELELHVPRYVGLEAETQEELEPF